MQCSPWDILQNPVGERGGVGHHAGPRRGQHDVRGQDEQEEAVPLPKEVEAAAAAAAQTQSPGQILVVAEQPTLGRLRGRGRGGSKCELWHNWKPEKPGGLLGQGFG